MGIYKNSIERVEGIFEEKMTEVIKLIKTIGLLQIFGHKGSVIDISFIIKYAKFSLGVDTAEEIVQLLEKHKIILFSNYNLKYKLFEGTHLNIELAIDGIIDVNLNKVVKLGKILYIYYNEKEMKDLGY